MRLGTTIRIKSVFEPELTPRSATRDSEYHAGAGVIEWLEHQERACPDPAAAF